MKIPTIILLTLCLYLSSALLTLKGKDIPADYAIGKIMTISFSANGTLFFCTMDDIMGYINASTGVLLVAYELEEDQRILNLQGSHSVMIAKGKNLNMFQHIEEKYVKLQYSQFLQKQTFNKLVDFKKFMRHDYILTDQFLIKADNPYAKANPLNETLVDKYQILVNRDDKNQVYFGLVFIINNKPMNSGMGLASIKPINGKKNVCLQTFYIRDNKKQSAHCYQLDPKQQLIRVTAFGNSIVLTYKTYKVNLSQNMQKLDKSFKNEHFTFFQQMIFLGQQANNKTLDSQQSRIEIFYNHAKPQNHYSLQIFSRYMLVKKQDKVLANIKKGQNDNPLSVWGNSSNPKNNQMDIFVDFENGVLVCYRINEEDNTFKKIWDFKAKDAVKTNVGEKEQATEVDLQQQEKIVEQGQQKEQKSLREEDEDIQANP